ncbi:MAG: DUF4149 domain-containing protein [Acidobacteriota bacterium]
MQIWRTVNLAAIGAWIGAMLLFGAVVAPVAFKVLPNRELAGAVVSRVLQRLTVAGLVVAAAAGIFALVQGLYGSGSGAWITRVAVAVLALSLLLGSIWVSARMEGLRAEMGGIEQVEDTHPLRLEFKRFHRLSVRLYMGTLLLALTLFILETRARG